MSSILIEMAKKAQKEYKDDIILARVDGRLTELNQKDVEGKDVEFITTASTIGNDAYKRSMVMLMLYAIHKACGSKAVNNVVVQFSLSKGLYCDMVSDVPVNEEFIQKVKAIMLETVKKDIPIEKKSIITDDAIKKFNEYGMNHKATLFKYRRDSKVNVYSIDGYEDYYYGYMAPSTGMLQYFDLFLYDNGFVLQLPTKSSTKTIPEFKPQKKIYDVLNESTEWTRMLEVNTVGELNDRIAAGNIDELMLVQEALQEQKIAQIARQIADSKDKKFVLIAGPSSSGKTTFSHRLSVQLMACGLKPHPIAVDNFFVEREETPLDENGKYNFEDIHAIDIPLFNTIMNDLRDGKEVEMPTFNFKLGHKEYNGDKLKLGKEDILVIEGIHCLNDELTKSLPKESKFKIYISALTQLNIDEHNRIATTDTRLVRRMVRDFRTRGSSAQRTLDMWESVRKGEEKNIFPFQEEADAMFNSALIYELAVLKPFVEPILFAIGKDEPEYQEAKRLLKFLDYFLVADSTNIPNNSILREFVGGGCFKI